MSDNRREISWQLPTPEQLKAMFTMTGLEIMQAVQNGELPPPPMAMLMNMRVVDVKRGIAVFTGTPEPYHLNPAGGIHGGFAHTLLDSATGCAVHTILDAGMGYGTVQLNAHLVRAITVNTGEMRCESRVVHEGRSMATAEATLTDADGKIYAHGTSACMIFPLK